MTEKLEFFRNYDAKPINYGQHYAVFVPFVKKDDEWHLIYEVRSKTMRLQPLEVCFPGGKMEQGETAREAAVRGMQEELGILPKIIYGESDYLILRTGDVIHPVVGVVDGEMEILPSEDEVDHIFYGKISDLKDQHEKYRLILRPIPEFAPESIGLAEEYSFRDGMEEVPVFRVGKHRIWGITGRITENVLSFL